MRRGQKCPRQSRYSCSVTGVAEWKNADAVFSNMFCSGMGSMYSDQGFLLSLAGTWRCSRWPSIAFTIHIRSDSSRPCSPAASVTKRYSLPTSNILIPFAVSALERGTFLGLTQPKNVA